MIAGFIGIFIATDPETNSLSIYYLLAVTGSALYGLAIITIRQLGETEAPGTTFFYFTGGRYTSYGFVPLQNTIYYYLHLKQLQLYRS